MKTQIDDLKASIKRLEVQLQYACFNNVGIEKIKAIEEKLDIAKSTLINIQ
tara:strand:+ start:801 stop:953 length:153 start_codon:yes stop_codon:yes gene_type:complete